MADLDLAGWLSLAAVMLIGLPHGAFDGAVALHLGVRRGRQIILFLLAYTGLAGLVILFWLQFPALALGLFLAISMAHFGLADSRASRPLPRWFQGLCHGGLVSLWIPLSHVEATRLLFDQLAAGPAPLLWQMLAIAGWLWAAGLAGLAFLAIRQASLRPMLAEIALLAGLLWLLPPVTGFALYFCCVHSARHFRRIWLALSADHGRRQLLAGASLLTLASWAMAGLFFFWLLANPYMANPYMATPNMGDQAITAAGLQTVFILLAGLTVPHMLLIDGWFRPHQTQRVTR